MARPKRVEKIEIPDDLWAGFLQLISVNNKNLSKSKVRGRVKLENREIFCAVIWVMRYRKAWNDLPPQYCSSSAAWARFHEWTRAGLWDQLVQSDMVMHPLLRGVYWEFIPPHGWMPVLARRVRIKNKVELK